MLVLRQSVVAMEQVSKMPITSTDNFHKVVFSMTDFCYTEKQVVLAAAITGQRARKENRRYGNICQLLLNAVNEGYGFAMGRDAFGAESVGGVIVGGKRKVESNAA